MAPSDHSDLASRSGAAASAGHSPDRPVCRHCSTPLTHSLIDLGSAPPSNAYLSAADLHGPELWLPLKVLVCNACWLVQTQDFAAPEQLFDAEYGYFSSMSASWLAHAKRYATEMTARLGLGPHSRVVEIASNDGYLLRNFVEAGIPCLGIEPTAAVAAAARALGVETQEVFFGKDSATLLRDEGFSADLMAANNVLAHVPDITDFAAGFAILLKPDGVATFEFPHLLNMIRLHQFDTIYHEHFSYLSLLAVEQVFARAGLSVFDIEVLPTHGGSLRVFAQKTGAGRAETAALAQMRQTEAAAGMGSLGFYAGFQRAAETIKDDTLRFLLDARSEGKTVAAYGAAAKGNTLLNFAGVRPDLLPFVVDRSPGKQGRFMPGSRIPITGEERMRATRPDYVLILPWNLKSEISGQLAYIRDWDGQFVVSVPTLEIF